MRRIALGLLVTFAAIQLIAFERTNPPVTADVQAPPEVAAILRRACYDCHSNETVWPWYSRVAPASWLLHHDVVEGRHDLNFSEWGALPAGKQARKLKGIGNEVREGEMPPWYYLPMHRAARLTDEDRAVIARWTTGAGG